ncbi:DUF115 domain-containing protein [Leptospira fluminis]|uniref:DUF115 domain-containing protein n=1 Tax=Leptospira fluminis TaxID=2484979 RepID=A0A4R9GMF6_9LEPT|nr:DUF115 domain-containing protein [Leptospira fluminis]
MNLKEEHSSFHLHSQQNPRKEGERIAHSFPPPSHNQELVLFIGIGCGYHVRPYLQSISFTVPVFCLEPLSELEPLLEEHLQEEIGEIPICYGWKNFLSLPKSDWLPPGTKSIKLCLHPTYARKFPELSREILETFRNFSPQDENRKAKTEFGRLWVHNYFRHTRMYKDRPDSYRWISRKLPVRPKEVGCFAGASPNLEAEEDWLIENRSKVFLLSSDASLGFLLSRKIFPDAVLSLDSGRGTGFHFPSDFPPEIPVITWLGGSARIFDLPNPKWLYFSTHPLDQFSRSAFFSSSPLLENPTLNLAGMAVSVFEAFGFGSCIAKGFDFRRESGKTHCRGTGYERYDRFFLERKESMFRRRYVSEKKWERRKAVLGLWEEWSPLPFLQSVPKETEVSSDWKLALSGAPPKFPGTGNFWRKADEILAEFPSEVRSILERQSRILDGTV